MVNKDEYIRLLYINTIIYVYYDDDDDVTEEAIAAMGDPGRTNISNEVLFSGTRNLQYYRESGVVPGRFQIYLIRRQYLLSCPRYSHTFAENRKFLKLSTTCI